MSAITPIQKTSVILGATPGWVNTLSQGVPGATAAYNFQTDQYWSAGNPSGGLGVISTTPQYVIWSDGHVSLVAAGSLPVSDLGLAIWEASSNQIVSTNNLSSWSATNMTVGVTTGPDLINSSASTIMATANNATITTTTLAISSSNQQASAFVQRITGSGAVSMTVDGGTTWHTITVTSNWNQVSIPQQTLSSPVFGLKLATSGDEIAVWCAQVESGLLGPGPTAPMPSTASTRNIPSITFVPSSLESFTVLLDTNNVSYVGSVGLYIGGYKMIQFPSGTTVQDYESVIPLVATLGSGNLTTGPCSTAYASDSNSASLVANLGTVAAGGNSFPLSSPGFSFYIGSSAGNALALDGYVTSLVFWPSRDATLQALT